MVDWATIMVVNLAVVMIVYQCKLLTKLKLANDDALAECELYWQHQLRCYVENGGKAHCFRKEITRTKI